MKNPTHIIESLVGVVGSAASGKDSVASHFARHGYRHISVSDIVREDIVSRGQMPNRELQTAVANELRLKRGVGYWIDIALRKAEESEKKIALSGLYAPGEGLYLVKTLGGFLIGVVSDQEDNPDLRYKRLQSRHEGNRDRLSKEEFLAASIRENSGIEMHETNVSVLLSMAYFTIYNSSTIDELERQVDLTIEQLETPA